MQNRKFYQAVSKPTAKTMNLEMDKVLEEVE
jgi:hypothetical protein